MDENGRTALHRTVAKGLAPFVKFLIENDADINAQDKFEWTVLHCATKCETDPKEVLRILLKNHNLKGFKKKNYKIYESQFFLF